MDVLLVALVSAAFMAVAGFAFAVGQLVVGRNRLQRRLPATGARISDALTGASGDGIGALVAERFTEGRFGIGQRFRQELRLKLVRSGFFGQNAVQYYVFSRVCAVVAVPSVALFVCALSAPNLSTLEFVLAAAACAGVRVLAPDAYLSHRQSQQAAEYRLNFPDLLDLPSQPNPLLPDKGRQQQPNYGMVRMHPSRVIEFAGNELPDWRLAPMGGGWGDSVLQTVEDSLKDFAMIMGGLASMINDMKMDVIKVPELSRKLSTAEMTQKTMQRFGLANMAKSSINTLLLDKDEDWERITTAFGSTPELIRTSMTVACAAGGVPESRIMGNAPSHGLQGTGTTGGEQDIRNYYDDISSQQKSKYKPMLAPLDKCIQLSALGKYDPSVDYTWNPLYQPTPAEKAQTAFIKAQATQIYVNAGLINEDAMRNSVVSQLIEDDIYPGLEDAIDEYGAEPEAPPQEMMPQPPTC